MFLTMSKDIEPILIIHYQTNRLKEKNSSQRKKNDEKQKYLRCISKYLYASGKKSINRKKNTNSGYLFDYPSIKTRASEREILSKFVFCNEFIQCSLFCFTLNSTSDHWGKIKFNEQNHFPPPPNALTCSNSYHNF